MIVVGVITAFVLDAGRRARTGRIFPEPLSSFSLAAFGAFFLALTIGALSLLVLARHSPYDLYERCGLTLIVPITAAAALHLGQFDRLGPLLYLGTYVVVGVLVTWELVQGPGFRPAAGPRPSPRPRRSSP